MVRGFLLPLFTIQTQPAASSSKRANSTQVGSAATTVPVAPAEDADPPDSTSAQRAEA
ncbi:hypothetical protein PF005_g24957 [Phytophthora fragariae]|uniref:Uncharacterized protein n=1 Tax=Phytophthora fragariae TaxID=53985 RepID=A0A6A3VZZ9_9STRA|nr:hypothetical protein PF003_g3117 [Phytophthora fragariae]KAE9095830.1 hypothetical protein PF006_g23916 [Phytophthora fragariae]KAE9119653.1 hypothetical protein PF010_g7783 [Phytophthora fragariae]KAE9176434.1 hypothetical protein PF005_g24957 [Phytophthora fragariae]KAE9187022.1 hypothetical protein PF002_g25711 [Phytophthora fragariae]